MQFLAQLRRRTEAFDTAAFDALADAEAERMRRMYADGQVRQVWSRGDVPGALAVIEAADTDAARAAAASLPFCQAGMLDVEQVIPLLPYRGFAPRH
jgi:muconolactone delta-isomerase